MEDRPATGLRFPIGREKQWKNFLKNGGKGGMNLICPKCGLANAPEEQRCRRCGLLLRPEARKQDAQSERPALHIYRPGEEIEPSGAALRPAPYRALKVLIYLLCWLISPSVLGLGVYKLYFGFRP